METVRKSTHICDRVSASGRYEAAVIAKTRCGWAKFRECSELLHEKMFPLNVKEGI